MPSRVDTSTRSPGFAAVLTRSLRTALIAYLIAAGFLLGQALVVELSDDGQRWTVVESTR